MAKRRAALPTPDPRLFEDLEQVYRDADALYAGHACPSSTECCRFHITGREPYVTTIELALVQRAVGARGGPLSPKRRALPLVQDEGTCPLLTSDNRCAVYASRPLGCRTFWCERATQDAAVRQPALNELVRRVRILAEQHAPGAVQGRPLRRALQLP